MLFHFSIIVYSEWILKRLCEKCTIIDMIVNRIQEVSPVALRPNLLDIRHICLIDDF